MIDNAAFARLVDIVEGAVPSTKAKGMPAKFKHDPRGQTGEGTGSRRFWFRTLAGAAVAPAALAVNRLDLDRELVMEYQRGGAADADALDAIIVEDYRAVAAALADGRNWQASTSGLLYVGSRSDQPAFRLFEFSIDDVDGVRRLRVRVPLQIKVLP